jgi:hypothetical protein
LAAPVLGCVAYVGGRPCGRRVAKLYLRDAAVFACRQCCGLAYASQQEIPRRRAISRAQKARMRLGGSANLLEPFPKKPRGMHRWTYYRLSAKAMAAHERSIALESDYLRRHYPEVQHPSGRAAHQNPGWFDGRDGRCLSAEDRSESRFGVLDE